MNLDQFIRHFGTEKKCISFIKSQRELHGILCPNCNKNVTNWREKQKYWRCTCGKKISLKSGTIMESTKLSFSLWFKAIYLMSHIKKSYSIAELARILGINRYRTVWYLSMKLRVVMGKDLLAKDYFQYFYLLSNTKESNHKLCKVKNKSISAIKKSTQPGKDEINLIAPLQHHLSVKIEEAKLLAGSYRCIRILGVVEELELENPITPTKPGTRKWINKILSNANRVLAGAHHGVSQLHLQKYMFEFSFNYNQRYEDKFSALLKLALE